MMLSTPAAPVAARIATRARMRVPCPRTIGSILLLTVLACGTASAQSWSDRVAPTGGTSWLLAFPDTTTNAVTIANTRYSDRLIIAFFAAVDTRVMVTGEGYMRMLEISARSFDTLDVTAAGTAAPMPVTRFACAPTRAGVFRVEATSPIVIYQFVITRFGTEAWAPLPIEAWGTDYVAAGVPGEMGSNVVGTDLMYPLTTPRPMPAELLVIAAYDDTRFSVGVAPDAGDTCGVAQVTLNAGDAYLVQTPVLWENVTQGRRQPSLAGARILSNKPVGVLSGNTRAMVTDTLPGWTRNSYRNMLMEWLRPQELHGTRFMYLPTRDGRQWNEAPNSDNRGRRAFERIQIVASGTDSTLARVQVNGAEYARRTIAPGQAWDTTVPALQPALVTTSRPAQTMLVTPTIARTVSGIGYSSWGSSMTDLIDTSRWVAFAPVFVPYQSGMSHFVTIVTTASHANDLYFSDGTRLPVNGTIIYTEYVWATVQIPPGEHWIEAREGARFTGRVFGTLTNGGWEEVYGTGRFPARYTEYLAISYAYPLVGSTLLAGPGDSLEVRTSVGCDATTVEIIDRASVPVGLRSVRLDTSTNARIASLTPVPLTAATRASVTVAPEDPRQDASATVVIVDRSGRTTRVPYRFTPVELQVSPADGLDFGTLAPGERLSRSAIITNPTSAPISITAARFASGDSVFRLRSAALPATVRSDSGQVVLQIEAAPREVGVDVSDTLLLVTTCRTFAVPVHVATTNLAITVGDLEFGVLEQGSQRSMTVDLCNIGGGDVQLVNPAGGPVIEWGDTSFTMLPAELGALGGIVLRPRQCVRFGVTFSASVPGDHRAVARIWATTRNGRDTSVWTGRVTPVTAVHDGGSDAMALDVTIRPVPANDRLVLEVMLPRRGSVELKINDAAGRPAAALQPVVREAGRNEFEIDSRSLPAGVYSVTLSFGNQSRSRRFVIAR